MITSGRTSTGSTSWENWAQSLVELYNDMAALAVYDETPQGVLDRWRIEKIVVVPDGALPLVPPAREQRGREPSGASTQPNSQDRSVDLQWGFPAAFLGGYSDLHARGPGNPFDLAPILLHEIGHARYLVDVYAFDVAHAPPVNVIEIEGLDVFGTHYSTPEQGLMNRHFTFIDRYSAIAFNRIAGHRAISGNYNDPDNIGSFLNDLPAQNRLAIRDAEGNLLSDAVVEIYQSAVDLLDEWYATHYDAIPDLRLQTDANGQVLVGRNPFSNDGPVLKYWRGSNAVAIIRVEKNGTVHNGFLESRVFNLAYWRGNTLFADHELVVGRPFVCGSTGPRLISPTWEQMVTSEVELTWAALPHVERYRVFAASPAQPQPRLLGETTGTSLRASLSGRTYWWVDAAFTDGCPSLRSAASRLVLAPAPRRRAVR